METAIVRPPLVYGPGVRANFLRLLHWVERGWPLPLGAIRNERSFVSVWNLCDLLANLVDNPRAGGQTWMVSDGEDLSTPELLRRIGTAMNKRVTLVPIPVPALSAGAALLGRASEAARLCGSLVVDISATRERLGWAPPMTVDEGLSRTTDWYLSAIAAHAPGR
jgi:nucleoside-diphosphate-sugar epimerase